MDQPRILLCGATGELGGAVARALDTTHVPFRVLLRPGRDAAPLEALGAGISRGDFRDPASLSAAMSGVTTVISTVNAIGRLLAGGHDGSIHDVDDRGYANVIKAAEAAGVARFVYMSALSDQVEGAGTPFTDAKLATEARLRESALREVIVRGDMFQEVWLGPAGGFDLAHGKVTIYGTGRTRHRLIAVEDVALAIVQLALADDPPAGIDLVGPDAMTTEEAVTAFEAALGHPLHRRHIPRIAMRLGKTLARPFKPEIASIMGMALLGDTHETTMDDTALRSLGIIPRSVGRYIEQSVAAAAR